MLGFDALSEKTKEYIRRKMRETRRALTDALDLLETAKPEECTEKALNIQEIVKALMETKTLPETEELYLLQWQGIILGELEGIQKCLKDQEVAAARKIIRKPSGTLLLPRRIQGTTNCLEQRMLRRETLTCFCTYLP